MLRAIATLCVLRDAARLSWVLAIASIRHFLVLYEALSNIASSGDTQDTPAHMSCGPAREI